MINFMKKTTRFRVSGSPALRGFGLVAMAVLVMITGVILIIHHRDSVNNALETGQCLVDQEVNGFFEILRHFLHLAYRWIFKACG